MKFNLISSVMKFNLFVVKYTVDSVCGCFSYSDLKQSREVVYTH